MKKFHPSVYLTCTYFLSPFFLGFGVLFFFLSSPTRLAIRVPFAFFIYINPLCVVYMNGFFTLILFPLSSIIPTRRWFFLCIFCREVYLISFLFPLSLYCGPMDLLEVASFVVLHGCGAYTPYLAFLHCE